MTFARRCRFALGLVALAAAFPIALAVAFNRGRQRALNRRTLRATRRIR